MDQTKTGRHQILHPEPNRFLFWSGMLVYIEKAGDQNGNRDQRFDQAFAYRNNLQYRQCQRNRMANGESGCQNNNIAPVSPHKRCCQRYQKSQVVVSLEVKNMMKAKFQVSRKNRIVQK